MVLPPGSEQLIRAWTKANGYAREVYFREQSEGWRPSTTFKCLVLDCRNEVGPRSRTGVCSACIRALRKKKLDYNGEERRD